MKIFTPQEVIEKPITIIGEVVERRFLKVVISYEQSRQYIQLYS